ncbi:Sushi, von Willebrand factor type A, EGF and pentraxin domain-containing protein 1 [Lamellibrachia satsuma]|nr:Sushi, von Willebrand factor type A, EGF and pentraxin domain-containing protein 1 [Lamellibrachia satsuma]
MPAYTGRFGDNVLKKGAIECPVLELPSHTRLTNGETGHTYGTTLNYQCSEGHELISGDLQTSCEATGKWSGQEPLCRVTECGPLAPVAHANPSTSGESYVSVVEYKCDEGYRHTGGALSRTCQTDKRWSGIAPVCTVIECGPPPTIAHANPSTSGESFLSVAEYKCDEGYTHTGGALSLTCQADKRWSGSAPVCTGMTVIEPGVAILER